MANFCADIVCGNKYLYKSDRSELVCRVGRDEEQIMQDCDDFDAVMDENGDIHIGTIDTKGNLIYIKNHAQRWGRGVIAENAAAENVFIVLENEKVNFYYVNENYLCCLIVDNEVHSPERIDKVFNPSMIFASENDIYYVNEKSGVMKNAEEIYSGRNIKHLFAAGSQVCIKDGDELKLIDTANNNEAKSLTRRHGRNAGCPIVAVDEEFVMLCWMDEGKVYSAKKNGTIWQRLEEESTDGFEKVTIFKFSEHHKSGYVLGCVERGMVKGWGENSDNFQSMEIVNAQPDKNENSRNLMEEFHNRLNLEILLGEIRSMHKKILEMDKKIEKIKKNHALQIVSGISKSQKQRSLCKIDKK